MAIRLPPLDDREIVDARDMSLSAWLNLVLDARKRHRILIIDYEFPSEDHKREYLASVKSRSEEDIKKLLRLFLLDSGVLGHDSLNVQSLGVIVRDGDSLRRVLGNEYDRRLITYALGIRKGITRPPPWEGNTWALDLLPHWPRQAIEAINGYVLAHAQQLPDGRYNGLLEAAAVIRARYIEPTGDLTRERAAIFSLTPREFEHLVERLYAAMGYETTLTPPSADGGRDVIARRSGPGATERLLIECKLHEEKVGVEFARGLLGVVTSEKANKGVLICPNGFTKGAQAFAEENVLELIPLSALAALLNEHLTPHWSSRLDTMIIESRKTARTG